MCIPRRGSVAGIAAVVSREVICYILLLPTRFLNQSHRHPRASVNSEEMQLIIHRVEDAGLHRICSCSPSVFVLNPLIPVVLGLRTTVGSPCTDVCHQTSNETTPADIVCLDSDYNTTITGSNFQKCVECQLRSSYADNYTGETDVLWGLCMLFHGGHFCLE